MDDGTPYFVMAVGYERKMFMKWMSDRIDRTAANPIHLLKICQKDCPSIQKVQIVNRCLKNWDRQIILITFYGCKLRV